MHVQSRAHSLSRSSRVMLHALQRPATEKFKVTLLADIGNRVYLDMYVTAHIRVLPIGVSQDTTNGIQMAADAAAHSMC
eukprot:6490847-Amphidinium_carterae.1